jgi:sugar phosphate isomerase/epimerase
MQLTKRREFLRQTLIASLGLAASTSLFAQAGNRKLPAIGFITGIVNNFLKEDWKATLASLAAMGYTEMEGGWNLGGAPAEMLAFCKSIGINPIAGGMALANLMEDTEAQIEKALQAENKYLICYWPWLGDAKNITTDQCKASSDMLNKIGEMCNKAGLTFCWHNHDMEFNQNTGDGTPYDLLLKYTDPELVKVQLDLYWTKKGGADPLEVLKKYAGRYPLLHLKDMNNAQEKDFACPGMGIIDFAPLLSEALDQGIKHFIVERDGETDGINCLQNSSHYLHNLRL